MSQGIIKKLIQEKGFGFIKQDNGGDVFFHHSVVDGISFEELTEGQSVSYEISANGEKGKGPRASRVEAI